MMSYFIDESYNLDDVSNNNININGNNIDNPLKQINDSDNSKDKINDLDKSKEEINNLNKPKNIDDNLNKPKEETNTVFCFFNQFIPFFTGYNYHVKRPNNYALGAIFPINDIGSFGSEYSIDDDKNKLGGIKPIDNGGNI